MLGITNSATEKCAKYTGDDVLMKCQFECPSADDAGTVDFDRHSFEEFDCCCGQSLPEKASINLIIEDEHPEPCECHETSDGRYIIVNYGNIEKIPEKDYAVQNYQTCEDILEDKKYMVYECPLGDVTGIGGCDTFDSSEFSTGTFTVSEGTIAKLTIAFIIGSMIF